ncbi:T9SS C-terminal target domain-containing protein, partial [Weeksellaceae bacterium A-14]
SGGQDILSDVSLTPDRQYLIAGSSINNNTEHIGGSANSGYDYHLVKLDQQGNPVWEKYYGGSGHDYLSSAVATQEGGFLLCGTSYSGKSSSRKKSSKGSCDLWLIKTDENGEEQWQQV